MQNGCDACHAVRGTAATGRVGPDLTHLGGRKTLGAGLLPVTAENISRFVRETDHTKPGVEMPAFNTMSEADAAAIAAWLGDLT